jgi:hypothetical protein
MTKKHSDHPVPLGDICAIMCNYARPHSARACVRRLRGLGITEIIVWNNGVEPIPEATQNINLPENVGPIGKYKGALHTTKPYILIVDDDYLLTNDGLRSLRRWAGKYPMVAQQGHIFRRPFNCYLHRKMYQSHNVKTPQQVDMTMPNKGTMIKTGLYRQLLNHWAWRSSKVVRPGVFSTDLAASCSVWSLTGKHPAVIPVNSKGYEPLRDEAPHKALRNQKNIYKEKSKELKWLVVHGWKMIES